MCTSSSVTRRIFLGSSVAVLAAETGIQVRGQNADERKAGSKMEYTNFLSDLGENDLNRRRWWERFQKAETLARSCVGKWEFAALNAVIISSDRADWSPNGSVYLSKDALNHGAMYHEIFHPVLHNSPFKKKAESSRIDFRLYCECLCNAFQYFMEAMVGPKGFWSGKVADWKSKSWGQIIAQSGDIGYDMTYGLPALEFIKSCNGFDQFRRLVADLNAKSR
jgi:hypothetical protein